MAVISYYTKILREFARLTPPVIVARAGIITMAFVDIVMVGRLSAQEVAYVSLGTSIFMPIMVTGIGLILGVGALISRSYGQKNYEQCGVIWRRGMAWAFLIGLIGCLICLNGHLILTLLGQEETLAREGGAVAFALAFGIPMQLMQVNCALYLENTQRPWPSMFSIIAANCVNIAVNWVLIYGNLGFPELGAVGSAITTSVVRLFLLISLCAYIFWDKRAVEFGIQKLRDNLTSFWGQGGWSAGGDMRKIGLANGASTFSETAGFSLLTQFVGWLGALPLAAFAIATNVQAICFMIGLGVSSATLALVGANYGRNDPVLVWRTGITGLLLSFVLLSLAGVGIYFTAPQIAEFYTNDEALVTMAIPLIALMAIFIALDSGQIVMATAVRSLGDKWPATLRYAIAFIAVMVPAAYLFIHTFGFGIKGAIFSFGLGCSVSLILQLHRFRTLVREMSGVSHN